MIEITLGITGLAPREAIALASTCAVSRAVGRAVGYSLHDWAGSADHPDLWVADGEAPEFQLQNTPTSVSNHFEGRTVWVSKAPWPTNDLVLRRPISWPLLLSGLDGLAASKGFIEYKTAPTLRPSEPVRRALFVGSSPALLLQLEAALIPLNIYLIPAVNEEITIGDFVAWCHEGLRRADAIGEILIIDSSSDRTAEIALESGARVLKTPKRGLGRAYIDALTMFAADT